MIVLRVALVAAVLMLAGSVPATAQAPSGQFVLTFHVTIAPSWFDPSTAPPQITPFGILYAVHDALVRPYPGTKMGPSLAESWKESPDGKTYEFKLRPNLKFHNGDPITTEDVKFSYERYKGAAAKELQARIREVEIVDPLTVRFHLKEPWPDFMTFYGTTTTAAGIVLPKKYLAQVGDEGFLKHPIGAGPYKFVSQKQGVEILFEAYTGYWRKVPHVKRLLIRSVPDANTRAVMLKSGDADMSAVLDGPDADDIRKTKGFQVVASKHASIFWLEFTEQWDPKSPWHDLRLRLAVNHALNRQGINEAACLGFCPPAGVIVPRVMDFALQVEPPAYDPARARKLLTEAGYPNGIDAGEFVPIPGFPTVSDGVLNDLIKAGIRMKMRPMERATFYSAWREKKIRGVFMTAVGNSGNAASRVQEFIQSKGSYAYGGYPDIDDLFQQQSRERDVKKREAMLHKIQQLTIDRVMYAPLMDLRALMGVGPRVLEHTVTSIWMSPWPAYEDVKVKE